MADLELGKSFAREDFHISKEFGLRIHLDLDRVLADNGLILVVLDAVIIEHHVGLAGLALLIVGVRLDFTFDQRFGVALVRLKRFRSQNDLRLMHFVQEINHARLENESAGHRAFYHRPEHFAHHLCGELFTWVQIFENDLQNVVFGELCGQRIEVFRAVTD